MSNKPRSGAAATPAARRARALRWAVGVGAALVTAIGLVLMFLLAQATNNRALYERYYVRLFGINVVVAVLLVLVIGWVAFRLLRRLRQGKFGSRLLIKLAAIFALVGVVPGALVYVVSYQFVARSIESWFDVKVEGALDAGLNLGRATLDSLADDLAAKTRVASAQLVQVPDASAGLVLERIRDQLQASDVVLWTGTGQLVAGAGASRFQLNPERPTTQQLRQVRADRAIAHIEGLDETAPPGANVPPASVRALAMVQRPGFDFDTAPRFLQVTQPLPPAVVANALAVQEANREYQERALAREGLRRMYIGTLTLSLFLAVFGAVLLAVLFGNQLARPLLVLADGVRQVAGGDLRPTAVLQGKDELGGLTRSFAVMTQQLADARGAVEKTMGQLDAARANLQTILDNLTSGVIVLDAKGTILSTNPGATRVLRAPLAAYEGMPLAQVPGLADFGNSVQQQFDEFQVERLQHGLDHWQHAFELHASGTDLPQQDSAINIVARGAELPGAARLLVFDDISEIVSAQRAQAWGEVARRLAHEIKNPLTPIQLSAERLEMKLSGKVAPPEQAVLVKSVKTIVDQVDAMKRLVNEFRDYARLPAADLKPVDLNALLADVLQLYSAENAPIALRSELDERCPPIRGDAQQIRQVIHNLLQNAQDAAEAAASTTGRAGEVVIRTRLGDSGQRVRLTVQDSGPGFAENILKRAFEPYVTTKTKGTGLGLAVVKKIADEHGARIELSNRVVDGAVAGAQVSLSFALAGEPQTAVAHTEDPKSSAA
ncbi:nitrogen fixation/metabolism regulation signal transduction histidine kinase [Variovorax beijingensis]|uniref:histidine kinase n=2 Tax=Variovorax TaxID=34072 RepID=A0AAE3XUD2_VARPD|nr:MULTISPECIES: ATP-binding protein [Variovorax]MBD9666613.1 HAMP domain-containing protein [Variovorax sp. VRV01]MDP9966565.1 nitrogen fixation/metabolism regulation signal transduction histidine kinase [Variovorax paradoxus]MDR6423891.1 nitrogen fixation/metabolism regulation signal transduction histidine kinase [Variovorax paradoxus]MDR6452835.1 nitrogen fixation/metabolism regulation signal transduction histidine kinase [Variovorax paradoxus]TWD87212.1 nitrogen fixation/metabolism regulat